jgi:uncharacterized OB-fold protein
MAEYRKPLPLPDSDSQPFWESCRMHAMALQQCVDCKQFRYPPRALCPACHSREAQWKAVSGDGRVYASLVMCRSPGSAWEEDVPYNVALIELDEHVRMWSNVIGCPAEQVEIGDRVAIVYEDVTETISLPKFRRAD